MDEAQDVQQQEEQGGTQQPPRRRKQERTNASAGGLMLGGIFGIVAAIISAIVWALVALVTNLEIGWLAIGVGALTGFAVMLGARQKDPAAGLLACFLAVGGLGLGKLLIVMWVMGGGDAASEVLADKDGQVRVAFLDLLQTGGIDEQMLARLQDKGPAELPAQDLSVLAAHFAKMPAERKQEIAQQMVDQYQEEEGTGSLLKDAFSPHDILWCILALGAAWSIAAGKD